ncbi:MAG: hypothetical protein IJP31_05330 [Lachnospiraceae bacterium]|nr:hypothetical protein [Lachnospiraceae bacterium]
MYPNLEKVVNPYVKKKGREIKLLLLISILLSFLCFLLIYVGVTWESDKEVFLLFGGLEVLCITVIHVVRVLAFRRAKKLFQGFSEGQLHQMELECAEMQPILGIAVTSQTLISEMSMIPISDIVWVYQRNLTFSGVATMNTLVVADKNEKMHSILLSIKPGPFRSADKKSVEKILELIRRHSPRVYLGYSKELMKKYCNDFPGMVSQLENKMEEVS